jgi:hypothetical protein
MSDGSPHGPKNIRQLSTKAIIPVSQSTQLKKPHEQYYAKSALSQKRIPPKHYPDIPHPYTVCYNHLNDPQIVGQNTILDTPIKTNLP